MAATIMAGVRIVTLSSGRFVIASEAKQSSFLFDVAVDCFASLAMTV